LAKRAPLWPEALTVPQTQPAEIGSFFVFRTGDPRVFGAACRQRGSNHWCAATSRRKRRRWLSADRVREGRWH